MGRVGQASWRRAGGAVEYERRHRRNRRPLVAVDRVDDVRHFSGAEDGVDLGNFPFQLFSIPFGQTAGHDQPAARAALLMLRHLEDGVDRLLLRLVDEGAGVDHDHLGVRRVGGQLVAVALSQTEHHFGVHQILRAAERYQTDFHIRLLRHPAFSGTVAFVLILTGTNDTASVDTEWFRARARDGRSRRRRVRCPSRIPRAGRCRSGAGRDTIRTLPAAARAP